MKFDTVALLAKIEVRTQEQIDREEAERRERLMRTLQAQHAEMQPLLGGGDSRPRRRRRADACSALPQGVPGAGAMAGPRPAGPGIEPVAPFVRPDRKVGRNEPCPCGSGKKYKHCHGTLAGET